MTNTPHLLFYTCLFLLLCLTAAGQDMPPPLRIGMGFTGNAYRGDLTSETGSIWRAEPGANFTVDLDNDKPLRIQLNLGFAGFTEQADGPLPMAPEGVAPNQFVRTTFFYTDLRVQYRFLLNAPIQPYFSIGAGLFSFQPRDAAGNFLGENIFSRLPGEEYLTLIGSLPLSVGLEYKLNRSIGLGLEYTYRMTGSDYLDNIGQLGTASGNDQLHGLQLKLFMTLGQRIQPPSIEDFQGVVPDTSATELPTVPSDVPVYYRHKDGKLKRR